MFTACKCGGGGEGGACSMGEERGVFVLFSGIAKSSVTVYAG